MTTLSDKLNILLTRKRWSAEYLAQRADISQPYMSRLLSGQRDNPTRAVADRLAALLDVSSDWLLGGLTAADQCERCGGDLVRVSERVPAPTRTDPSRTIVDPRWWCATCRRHVVPLGYGKAGIEGLIRDERATQQRVIPPGTHSSKSGGRKRSKKGSGVDSVVIDTGRGGRRDAAGRLPGRYG